MPSPRKPKSWNLKPQLTAAPELWRGCVALYSFDSSPSGMLNLVTGKTVSSVNGSPNLILSDLGAALSFNDANSEWIIADNPFSVADPKELTFAVFQKWPSIDNLGHGLVALGAPGATESWIRLTLQFNASLDGRPLRMQMNDGSNSATADESRTSADQADKFLWCFGSRNNETVTAEVGDFQTSASNTINAMSFDSLVIGAWDRGGGSSIIQPYHGDMSIVACWERVLSEGEKRLLKIDPFAMLRPAGF